MDITARFRPLAQKLINSTFPTPIVYRQHGAATYDPTTGIVTPATTTHQINGAILKRARTEEGGTAERHQLELWIEHTATGLSDLPVTGDEIDYDGRTWRVVKIDPTYQATGLIASKLQVVS